MSEGSRAAQPMTNEPIVNEPIVNERGAIVGESIADLTHLKTPEDMAAITRIEGVATVLVRESVAAAYAAIPSKGVAKTLYVPDDANLRVHTGTLVVGGDGLGAADDMLVVVGLLAITSPVSGPVPRRICVVGAVLAPFGSEAALGPALSDGAGGVIYYRHTEGQEIKFLTGQVKLSGTMLANASGNAGDVLLAAGQAIVTGPVSSVGYAQVIVAGQLVAPESAQATLGPRLQVHGQTAWYRSEDPRVIMEDTELGADFFRLLGHRVTLVVLGDLTIAESVTEAAILEKVADIVLLGDIVAPAGLVGVLQVLTTEALGTIRARDGQARDGQGG